MEKKEKYNRYILASLMLLWLLPVFQDQFGAFPEKKLNGEYSLAADVQCSPDPWFEGTFAIEKEKYLNDNFSFRNFFVRLKNQVNYWFYGELSAKDVVMGKEGVLFEQKYIKSYYGYDHVGYEHLKVRFDKLKFVQDTFKKLNKDIVVLFAPGKADFFPEYIPDGYHVVDENTNYKTSIKLVRETGVNYIDYKLLFHDLKTKSKYPLYPKTGTHWSLYSMYMVQDTLNNYISRLRNIKLRNFNYDQIEEGDSIKEPDNDMELALNLLFSMSRYKMAYPKVVIDTNTEKQLNLLAIADSYWMGIYFTHVPQEIFKKHQFWYYNNRIHDYFGPDEEKNPMLLDLNNEINKYDVICIMASDANLKNIGWGFIEDAYKLYKYGPQSLGDRKYESDIEGIERNIYDSETWLNEIKRKSSERKIPMDSMIRLDAQWMYSEVHK